MCGVCAFSCVILSINSSYLTSKPSFSLTLDFNLKLSSFILGCYTTFPSWELVCHQPQRRRNFRVPCIHLLTANGHDVFPAKYSAIYAVFSDISRSYVSNPTSRNQALFSTDCYIDEMKNICSHFFLYGCLCVLNDLWLRLPIK